MELNNPNAHKVFYKSDVSIRRDLLKERLRRVTCDVMFRSQDLEPDSCWAPGKTHWTAAVWWKPVVNRAVGHTHRALKRKERILKYDSNNQFDWHLEVVTRWLWLVSVMKRQTANRVGGGKKEILMKVFSLLNFCCCKIWNQTIKAE